MLSERAGKIEESQTLAITSKIIGLKKRGIDVIGFGAGEPDFDTPDNIKQAAVRALKEGFTKYTDVSGISELKQAICNKFRRDNGVNYDIKEVMVSNGGKQILYNAVMALINKGDEVIIPKPYWVSYMEQVKLAEGKPVICKTEKFKIKADLIKEALSKNTKMIILNSPNNPTGMVCDRPEIKRIADLAIENNIWVLSDEVYECFVYDGKKHISIASLGEEVKNLTVTVNAVSKTYSMTGWRVGYCGAREELIKAMTEIQGHVTSNPCSIAQKAAFEALTGPQDSVKRMAKEFERRRNFMLERFKEMGLSCVKPEGAFYTFPNIKKFGFGSPEFCEKLLDKVKVAVVPGLAFGEDKNIRLSYATSMENITEGMNRFERFIKML